MYDYLEMEYEDIVEELSEPFEDQLFEEYYMTEEEQYSYSADWSSQNYYVEYWDEE